MRSAAAQGQVGLAAWLLEFFRMPMKTRFAGLGRSRTERRMQVVEVLPLGGKKQLLMVTCDGQRFLVGAGGDGVQTIVAMPPRPDEGSE